MCQLFYSRRRLLLFQVSAPAHMCTFSGCMAQAGLDLSTSLRAQESQLAAAPGVLTLDALLAPGLIL